MNYHLAAIPPEFPAPTSSTEFDRAAMTAMFKEGYALARFGEGWRRMPPGTEPGESTLQRSGTNLNEIPRASGAGSPVSRHIVRPPSTTSTCPVVSVVPVAR